MKNILFVVMMLLGGSFTLKAQIPTIMHDPIVQKRYLYQTTYEALSDDVKKFYKENGVEVLSPDETHPESADILLEANPRVHVISLTSINSNQELLNSLNGTQKLAFLVDVFQYKRHEVKKNLLEAFFSFNLAYVNPEAKKKDSIDIVSMMFPETGNAGWMFGLQANYLQNGHHKLSTEACFSVRNVRIQPDSAVADSVYSRPDLFSSLNYNFTPIKYTFSQRTKSMRFCFSVSPYINLFNIPNEDVKKFNALFDKDVFKNDGASRLWSTGVRVMLNMNNFLIFADARHNATTQLDNNNPIKGFVFNFGITSAINVFSFDLKD